MKSHLSSSFTILPVRFVDDGSGLWKFQFPFSHLGIQCVSLIVHSNLVVHRAIFSFPEPATKENRKETKNERTAQCVRICGSHINKVEPKLSPFSCVFVHVVFVAAKDCKVFNRQLSSASVANVAFISVLYIVRLLLTNFSFVLRQ